MTHSLKTNAWLAERLNVSAQNARTFYQRHPDFPRIKLGRLVRYEETDVEIWLKKHTVQGLD